jgi:hypothetical protein
MAFLTIALKTIDCDCDNAATGNGRFLRLRRFFFTRSSTHRHPRHPQWRSTISADLVSRSWALANIQTCSGSAGNLKHRVLTTLGFTIQQ